VRYYPPRKPPRAWRGTTGGSTRAWRTQRARILKRDGHRCTHIENGQRCPVRAPARLEAHHLNPGHGLDAPDHELATVCSRHNPRGGTT
jgi:hypothetical protein